MKNKALFLDRDGVINVEKNYVYRIEDFEFIDGVFETLKYFQDQGYLLIIITNQAGIGRGYYTEEDFHILNGWMLAELNRKGINISKVYFCPYHPKHGIGKYKKDSNYRKPRPGMLLEAIIDFDIDITNSILIGDRITDIEAGIAAGITETFLITKDENVSKNGESYNTNVIKDIRDLLIKRRNK
ncbi:D-glycero-alpha-D-manno-heptose-1,7-bisphosphate 7-phosphatase [Ammoniphilus resinae]|uniref:D,D-heptose 1,7-bisphosphate phosphatase n=1 Tax=Ammoniphilus resinae TaxID=861532 RepID=A0ABS4GWX4_9BACL|nr:HAD family hydrolase [Ammoniphilus resinae]MBP1934768.1 D-glycero-D-manno-heptose 1,7-bisphosphate phosphatase [Ammoniphilus resinae]